MIDKHCKYHFGAIIKAPARRAQTMAETVQQTTVDEAMIERLAPAFSNLSRIMAYVALAIQEEMAGSPENNVCLVAQRLLRTAGARDLRLPSGDAILPLSRQSASACSSKL